MTPVAVVRSLYRYPIKSMAAEPIPVAELSWNGLARDRRFGFRRVGDMSEVPWLTATKLAALVCYRPYNAGAEGDVRTLRVVTPEGEDLEANGAALRERLSQTHGQPVELLYLRHGIYDEAPVSLISASTLMALERASGRELDPRRFRPNIVAELASDEPFAEDSWIGHILAFGSGGAAMAVARRDLRCPMVNLDPETAAPDPRVLRAVGQSHEAYAGVYGSTFTTGNIRIGDEIHLLSL
ncbi:MAG TPA: MOSC domain-containing protein [Thermoanaerobaculia bacterium]|nr:MOSC domain-containing protein [Thermoanaerobaculia bacterium]